MGQNRSILILIAAGFIAFGAFVVFGQRAGGGGGDEGRGGGVTGARSAPGGEAADGALGGGDKNARAKALKTLKKKRAGGKKVDPKLARKLKVPKKLLVAVGPPESPKLGIVQQAFTGVLGGAGGAVRVQSSGTGEAEDASDEPADSADTSEACSSCGAPSVRSMIADVQAQPVLASAFDATCSSTFIDRGFGERFEIRGDPACVIFIPDTCRGSGAAFFDGRFFVSLQGECIPNREFLRDILTR